MSGTNSTVIDYSLARRHHLGDLKDCKLILGESMSRICQVKQNDSWLKKIRGDMSCKGYTQAINEQTQNGK